MVKIRSGGYSHLNELIKRHNKRVELGFADEDFILISVGELNSNKNHEVIIRALREVENIAVKYIICGQGELKEYLEKLIEEKQLEGRVKLLGYRTDVAELLHMADVFVFPSKREGLSVALMEAMASELPVICSEIRGNIDLIENAIGGCLIKLESVQEAVNAIQIMLSNVAFRSKAGIVNYETIEKCSISKCRRRMSEVYCNSV